MSDETTTIAPSEGEVQTAPTPAEAMPPHKESGKPAEERTFSQAELERILSDRLERERSKYADYEELRARSNQLKDIEDKNKSELDKAIEEAGAARFELESERTSNLRFRAAVKHGIPEEYLDLLTGSNEEEISSSAERIGKLVKADRELAELRKQEQESKDARHSTGRPTDNLRPGASPDALPIEDDSYPSSWLPQNNRIQR